MTSTPKRPAGPIGLVTFFAPGTLVLLFHSYAFLRCQAQPVAASRPRRIMDRSANATGHKPAKTMIQAPRGRLVVKTETLAAYSRLVDATKAELCRG